MKRFPICLRFHSLKTADRSHRTLNFFFEGSFNGPTLKYSNTHKRAFEHWIYEYERTFKHKCSTFDSSWLLIQINRVGNNQFWDKIKRSLSCSWTDNDWYRDVLDIRYILHRHTGIVIYHFDINVQPRDSHQIQISIIGH